MCECIDRHFAEDVLFFLIFWCSPFLPVFIHAPLESSCKRSIKRTHTGAHTCTRCCYAQETINYASLLSRPVTRQMNRKTKLARALATENLLQTHTHAHTQDHSLHHIHICSCQHTHTSSPSFSALTLAHAVTC